MVGLHKIPSINGYRGAFGDHLTTGVTIVVAATKSGITTPTRRLSTFSGEVTTHVIPATPINF